MRRLANAGKWNQAGSALSSSDQPLRPSPSDQSDIDEPDRIMTAQELRPSRRSFSSPVRNSNEFGRRHLTDSLPGLWHCRVRLTITNSETIHFCIPAYQLVSTTKSQVRARIHGFRLPRNVFRFMFNEIAAAFVRALTQRVSPQWRRHLISIRVSTKRTKFLRR